MHNKMDSLGRIVIPIQIRRRLNIQSGDTIDFNAKGDCLILKKADPCCIFCNGTEELTSFEEKKICCNCMEKIKKGQS